ncbi:hypothetical protein DesLBE_3135 [Desulfitobacterium sp. LBE]|nr:hypothetical protein DesLBE_3135 [Desulfitobacterium sp. LBE]
MSRKNLMILAKESNEGLERAAFFSSEGAA